MHGAAQRCDFVPAVRVASERDRVALRGLVYLGEGELAARMDRGRFLVADDDGGPIAAVHVTTDGTTGSIDLISVAPEQTGHGHDQRMLAVAESLCRAEGCRDAELAVESPREALIRHARASGYRVIEERASCQASAPSGRLVVLRKQLA